MSFWKKLFTKNKEDHAESNKEAGFDGVYTTDYFDQRYKPQSIDPEMLDGCLKMIEGYFIDNKIERKIPSPIHHPMNLDQLDQEGFGLVLYCRAFQMGEEEATMFLAYAFSDYLIGKYDFKLYSDTQPEYPLRHMTLKYDKNGVVLSLYPFEFANKVLNGNDTFTELEERISSHLSTLPGKETILNKIRPEDGGE